MTITALNQSCADYFTTRCGIDQIRHPKNLRDRIEGIFKALVALTVVIPILIGFTYIVTTPFNEHEFTVLTQTPTPTARRVEEAAAPTSSTEDLRGYATPDSHSPRAVNGTPESDEAPSHPLMKLFIPGAKAYQVMNQLNPSEQREVKKLVAADSANTYKLSDNQIEGIKHWPLPAE